MITFTTDQNSRIAYAKEWRATKARLQAKIDKAAPGSEYRDDLIAQLDHVNRPAARPVEGN